MAQWRFPSNDYGEKKGINDSGVSLFKGTPLRSLAREICQNSLDAARAKTVRVEFNAFDISPSQLPGCNDLKDAFERCSQFWGDQKAITTKQFFSNAIEKITSEKIHMLRISDFFTSGLTGSREEVNTHWTNLTKSSGVSDKKGTSGGSFGIGKFAPFACSDFSTVFYSTYDEEENTASQGVSRLVTFRRQDGQTTQGVGYFGEERNTPSYSQMVLEPGFSRENGAYGTDIYIAGYKHFAEENGWEKSIVVSILDSFLGAVWHEKLIVKVGEIEISKNTLNDLIETYRDELTGHTEQYYKVLLSDKTKWYEEDFLGLGIIRLGLAIGDSDAHRKVAMIRQTGMKIKEQDRISSFIPFVGVMFIDGDKINARLRELENPEHTEWQVARAENEVQARALLRSINDFIRKKVEELASENGEQYFDVEGLSNLLPDEPDDTKEVAKEENVTDKTITIEKRKPQKSKPQTPASNIGGTEDVDFKEGGYVEGDSVLGFIHKNNKRQKRIEHESYPVDISEEGTEKIPTVKNITPQKLRIICTDKKAGKYIVMFVPNESAENGTIHLSLAAESCSYDAPIINASIIGKGNLTVSGTEIKGVEFIKDAPVRLNVQIDFSDYCSMEVKAYAD